MRSRALFLSSEGCSSAKLSSVVERTHVQLEFIKYEQSILQKNYSSNNTSVELSSKSSEKSRAFGHPLSTTLNNARHLSSNV